MGFKILAVLSLLLGVSLLLHTFLYSESWQQREHARRDLENLIQENNAKEREIDSVRRRIQGLRTHKHVQERAVRHELGYTRPDEIVIELQKESSSTSE